MQHPTAGNTDGGARKMEGERVEKTGGLKTLPSGLILHPQPSDDPSDPLNWSSFRKHAALATISYLAFMTYMSVTAIVPATLDLADSFGTTSNVAVYIGSVPVALYGVGPFLWAPLSHFTGRRPVLMFTNVLCFAAALGVAASQSYGACMTCRILSALGGCSFWGLGPASISDIFFRHEKGRKIGICSIFIVVSPFVGSIIGGAIIQNESLGWRWTQWISAILIGVGFPLQVFFLPETIYVRGEASSRNIVENDIQEQGFIARAWRLYGFRLPKRREEHRKSWWFIATRPFVMFTYIPVLLSSFWFGVAYMSHVGITSLIPLIFQPAPFHFSHLDVGLTGFSGLIGALVGELFAGPVIDYIAKRSERRHGMYHPEMRLQAIYTGLVAAPLGILMFGLTTQYVTTWVPPIVGQGVYIFGIEILTTIIQTYVLESFPEQGPEATLAFNFARNIMSFTTPFFITPYINKAGRAWAFGTFSILIVVLFPFTIGVLMWKGPRIRDRQGKPNWGREI